MKTVLLVDDDESTRLFVHFALKQFLPPVHLRYLHDGIQAMRYLKGYGLYSDRGAFPFPDFVLLDLKMPLVDGFEMLEWTRAQADFRDLPVVVLTESSYEPDIARARRLGATAFVPKSVDLTEFELAVRDVFERLLPGSPPTPEAPTHLAKAA